jgi:hypothetical protein
MSDFVQGQSVDFASAQSESAVSETPSTASFFSKAWQVTQKLASDVGVPDVFSDVHKKVNIIKAQQMGNKLELVEKVIQSILVKPINLLSSCDRWTPFHYFHRLMKSKKPWSTSKKHMKSMGNLSRFSKTEPVPLLNARRRSGNRAVFCCNVLVQLFACKINQSTP